MKKAFTLAEVLVTLGVIGVVAALTMPTLIAKYQEHVTVNKVKKWYSMMSQAILMSISQNGNPDQWNVSDDSTEQSKREFAEYIKPYLKIIEDCGTRVTATCYAYDETTPMHSLNGALIGENYADYYKMHLADGSYVWFRTYGGDHQYCSESNSNLNGENKKYCAVFYFDVNAEKAPNTIGKDIFAAFLSPQGILKTAITDHQCDINSSTRGWGCISRILKDGKMDYLRK